MGRRARGAVVMGVMWVATAGATVAPSSAQAQASAPTQEALDDARKLFNEAYKDEQERRFAEALEKFRRVAKVKESPSVRYRIASCLEELGKLREARDEFRALAATKSQLPQGQQDIADSAAERARELDRRVPKLVVKLAEGSLAPTETRVMLDGAPVPVSTAPRAVEVDPGEHVLQASTPNAKAYERKVVVGEATETPLEIAFEKTSDVTPPESPRNDTLAYVALGAGGVLLVTGGALLIAREGAISDIEQACPGNVCPTSRRSDVESDRDRAELFGPLGVTLGVVGIVAAGVGAFMLLRPSSSRPTHESSSQGLRFGGSATPTGVLLGASGAF